MPPLARQQTPQSIHSWWSDSNPVGATVSIHAAAKPLMKMMYHSQARGFVKRCRDVPLSKEVLDIYLGYLMFKYVSSATKTMIFSELHTRARSEEAPVVVEWLGSDGPVIMELLNSFDPSIQRWACAILGELAGFQAEVGAVVTIEPCRRLVTLLSDSEVCAEAIYAMAEISKQEDVAQTLVKADSLLHVQDLLKSTSADIRRCSVQLLGNLACHDSTATAVQELAPCAQLVSLSKHVHFQVRSCAIYALSMICNRPEGALAAVNANVVELLEELMTSQLSLLSRQTLNWMSVMLEGLTEHQPGPLAVLYTESHWQFIFLLLSDDDVEFKRYGLRAVKRVLNAGGARDIVEADVLRYVGELLEIDNEEIREQTCAILGDLASHLPPILLPLWDTKVCRQLISLSSDTNPSIRRGVIRALWNISDHPVGAETVVKLNGHHDLSRLLDSSDRETAGWMCKILGRLAFAHRSLLVSLGIIPCRQLVSFMSDSDVCVRQSAIYVLTTICMQSGAQTVMCTNVFDYVSELLRASDPRDLQLTLELVGYLVDHTSTATEALEAIPYQQLVLLSNSDDVTVYSSAASAQRKISLWQVGAKAVLNAGALDYVPKLLDSADANTRGWSCAILGNFARHDLLSLAGLAVVFLKQLVSLLSDSDTDVRRCSADALYHISRCGGGERAVVNANVLEYVLQLLDSDDHDTQKWTLLLVGRLADHDESTALEILRISPCQQLVFLSNSDDMPIYQAAASALLALSQWPDGARAVFHAGALPVDWVPLWSSSDSSPIKGWTCAMLGDCMRKVLTLAQLDPEVHRQLVTLLSDNDEDVRGRSTYALYQVSRGAGGERAILDAGVLDCVSQLLHSNGRSTQKWTLLLVGQLANHAESTARDILHLDPCQELVFSSNSDDLSVYRGAAYALSMITQWSDGAQAVLNAGALNYVPKLLDSPDRDTKEWVCSMLGNFARYKFLPTAGLLMRLVMMRLVSLLSDGDVSVRRCSVSALYHINRGTGGERQALATAQVLRYVPQLLESNDRDTQTCTLLLVGALADRASTAMELLKFRPYEQ
ncbi:armadillo-type protein, partial [Mycena polygramma]